LAAGGAYFLHRRASNGAQRFHSLIVLPLKNLSGMHRRITSPTE